MCYGWGGGGTAMPEYIPNYTALAKERCTHCAKVTRRRAAGRGETSRAWAIVVQVQKSQEIHTHTRNFIIKYVQAHPVFVQIL